MQKEFDKVAKEHQGNGYKLTLVNMHIKELKKRRDVLVEEHQKELDKLNHDMILLLERKEKLLEG